MTYDYTVLAQLVKLITYLKDVFGLEIAIFTRTRWNLC